MEGNPLTPSHALKKGKRYRYYVSRPTKDLEKTEWASRTSVPAHDLEQLVVQSIARWLGDASRLMKDLHLHQRDADQRKMLLRRAESYAEQLRQGTLHDQRTLLLPCITWIQIHTEEVRITLRRCGTLQALGLEEPFDEAEDRLDEDAPTFSVAARLKRHGLEMRLVINEEWATMEEPEVDEHLVLGLARAHSWWSQLRSGEATSIAQIADKDRVTSAYVAKMLRGALLAPDIVEKMMEGRVRGVNSKSLLEPRAIAWAEQRSQIAHLTTGNQTNN